MRAEIKEKVEKLSLIHKKIAPLLGELPQCFLRHSVIGGNVLREYHTEEYARDIGAELLKALKENGADLYNALRDLREECEFPDNLKNYASPDPTVWNGYGLETIWQKYLHLRLILEETLLEIIGPTLNLYAYIGIPMPALQEVISDTPELLDVDPDLTFIDIEGDGKKSGGYPDINKFREFEREEHFLVTEISVSTQLINTMPIFALNIAGFSGSVAESFLEKVLEGIYRELFVFIYEQMEEAELRWEETKNNLAEVLPDGIKTELLEKIYAVINGEEYKKLGQEEQDKFAELIEVLNSQILEDDDLFDQEFPRIYKLNLREATSFEKRNYRGFFTADILLNEEIWQQRKLQAMTMHLSYSPVVYDIIERLMLGTDKFSGDNN